MSLATSLSGMRIKIKSKVGDIRTLEMARHGPAVNLFQGTRSGRKRAQTGQRREKATEGESQVYANLFSKCVY